LKRKISRIQYPPAGMGRDVANSVGMTQRPATMEELLQYCAALEQQNAQLKAQLQRLQEQLLLAQKYRFGRSSERIVPGQLQFVFNEVEAEAKPEEKEPELETVGTYKRKKKRRSRSAVLEGVPTEQIHYTLPEEQQHCPQCAGRLHAMGLSQKVGPSSLLARVSA
jgi:transposase